jgi:hypothetical protein
VGLTKYHTEDRRAKIDGFVGPEDWQQTQGLEDVMHSIFSPKYGHGFSID